MKKIITFLFILISTMVLFTACGEEETGSDLESAVSDMTQHMEGQEAEQEEKEEEAPEVIGRYDLVSVQRRGEELMGEDLAMRDMQDDYVYILENDEIELVLSGEVYPVSKLEMIDGYERGIVQTEILSFEFSLVDGEVTLYEIDREESYIFEYNASSTERIPYEEKEFVAPVEATTSTRPTEYITHPDVMQSLWYGTLEIYDFVDNPQQEGVLEAQAIIRGDDREGIYRFELYVKFDGVTPLSLAGFDIEIEEDTFYPIVNENGYINGYPINDNSAIAFVPTLKDGILSATYHYDNSGYEGADNTILSYRFELARYEPLDEKFALKTEEYAQDNDYYFWDEPVHTSAQLAELFKSFDYYGKTFDELKEAYGGTTPVHIEFDGFESSFKYVSTEDESADVKYIFTDPGDGRMVITEAYSHNIMSREEDEAVREQFGG